MQPETRGEIINPRASINTRLELMQEDLDGVERRLVIIIKELLGPQPIPEAKLPKEEEIKVVGWFNQIISRLDKFRNQLERIKELETDLKKSIIGPSEEMPKEGKELVERKY